MDNYDIKVAKKALYRPTRQWQQVDVGPQNYLMVDGHEIYLSDARRTEPARLRTVLRQPVTNR